MRTSSFLGLSLCAFLVAGNLACTNPFAAAQEADTIEAYETFLAENPNSPFVTQGSLRLEELYLEKARQDKTLESYDVYLDKYPKGTLREKAVEERRTFLFDWAGEQDTPEAWQKFLDEYPTGDKKLKQQARTRLNMAQHRDLVTIGAPSIEQINLAENPDGPLDGWGIYADVTVAGDKPVKELDLEVAYLGPEGQVLDTDKWPVVAPALPGNMPVEEEFKIPMKPGETRTFEWTTGDMPADWSKKVRLKPVDIKFVGEEGE
ncbi:MAG: hypothetical protein H6742_00060 [Alphaproteobacteria bacterium]|nr:hypothetical protein [Alphaproteobacteria bacterium]